MKRSTIIIIIVAAMSILTVMSFSLSPKESGYALRSGETIRTSIKNLMLESKPVKCVAMVDLGIGRKMTGTVYIASGKMRNDAEIEKEGEEKIKLHTIIDEEWFYSWSTDLPNGGVKMKISEMEEMSNDQENSSGGVRNLEKEFNFDCSKWVSKDSSEFIPPSNVIFQDFNQKIKDMQDITQKIETEDVQEMAAE